MKKENINSQISDLDIIRGIKARNEDILSLAMLKYEHYFLLSEKNSCGLTAQPKIYPNVSLTHGFISGTK